MVFQDNYRIYKILHCRWYGLIVGHQFKVAGTVSLRAIVPVASFGGRVELQICGLHECDRL